MMHKYRPLAVIRTILKTSLCWEVLTYIHQKREITHKDIYDYIWAPLFFLMMSIISGVAYLYVRLSHIVISNKIMIAFAAILLSHICAKLVIYILKRDNYAEKIYRICNLMPDKQKKRIRTLGFFVGVLPLALSPAIIWFMILVVQNIFKF